MIMYYQFYLNSYLVISLISCMTHAIVLFVCVVVLNPLIMWGRCPRFCENYCFMFIFF